MYHNIDIILTLTGGLTAALILGFITQKLKLSPILGYLLAGMLVGPYSPGFVADADTAAQFAEIGVILLMFGVGLNFHFKDLMAVRSVALPGAAVQITASTVLGMIITHFFGWSWVAGAVFGMAISVASTVVLTRILADNRALHTPIGHVAIGWLVVEDLFTILVLVLLPTIFSGAGSTEVGQVLGMAVLKLCALTIFMLLVGQRLLPLFLGYIARTGTHELFTLSVLAIALGLAVGAAEFFGASMALGAFLAGMVVGQSEFGTRAASDALPMRDAFAVLFFVSVGMLFNPASLPNNWELILATLAIVVIGKPLMAVFVVLALKHPLKKAISVGVALAQVGEFSFILASVGTALKILPPEAGDAIIVASVISITINPLLYKAINPIMHWLDKKGFKTTAPADEVSIFKENPEKTVIIVGYGPVGKTISDILRNNNVNVVIIEMNIDTVQALNQKKDAGLFAVHGDASQRQILSYAGISYAEAFIISPAEAPAKEIVAAVRSINPRIRILIHTTYLREAQNLRQKGAQVVFSGEAAVAASLATFLMQEFGATNDQIENERKKINEEWI